MQCIEVRRFNNVLRHGNVILILLSESIYHKIMYQYFRPNINL